MIAPLLSIARVVPLWAWALVALLAWGGWQKHRATASTKAAAVAEQRAAVEAATAEAERQARAAEQITADNARRAADAYASNLARARAAAAAARTDLDGLRGAIAAAPTCAAAPGASAPRGTDATAGLRQVLGHCAQSLQQLAEAADADAARVTALQDYVRAIGAASAPSR